MSHGPYTDADLKSLKKAIADYNAWAAHGFPVDDMYDTYPNDFLEAATQPSQLLALIERLEQAEASTCTARFKRIGRAIVNAMLLRFPSGTSSWPGPV